tara:strand:+ start:351 stop:800 length:450 start_codon:yes stop_codon:yes gene_type:complete
MTEQEIIKELHPDLQKIIPEAKDMCEIPFTVIEGKRCKERQNIVWYKGEDFSDQTIRSLGCAITVLATLDDIPCFSNEIYMEVADSLRFAASNHNIDLAWGGAIAAQGFINISEDSEALIAEIYEKCYSELIDSGKEFNPKLQYFQLFY